MKQALNIATVALLALVVTTQVQTTKATANLIDTVRGQQADLNTLNAIARGQHPHVALPKHVDPSTPTPYSGKPAVQNPDITVTTPQQPTPRVNCNTSVNDLDRTQCPVII